MPRSPHLILFDLYVGGHHMQYLFDLARYWVEHNLPGRLDVACPRAGLERHPELAAYLDTHRQDGLGYVEVEVPVGFEQVHGLRGLLRNDRIHGRLVQHHIDALQPDQAVFMYVDHAQVSLATRLRFRHPVGLSGIYFRPSFHYGALDPEAGPVSRTERLQRLRKRLLLRAALRNPHFHTLFSLDPYVVPFIEAWHPTATVVGLPDGARIDPPVRTPEAQRAAWGLTPDRHVLLLFGALDARKGLHVLFDALPHLPQTLQARVALVLAGRLRPEEAATIQRHLDEVRRQTAVEVVQDHRYILESEIQALIHASDVVLLPYQQHIGSSNVLVRAAAAGVPVLGPTYGLVGAHLRAQRLGLAVDSTAPRAVAQGIERLLLRTASPVADPAAMHTFANYHAIEHFGETFFEHLGLRAPTSS
ncbi:MAG: glycosyltransferase [Bacteroidota bacterium]